MIIRKLFFAVFLLSSGAAFTQIEPVINEEWIPESKMEQHEAFTNGDYAFPAKPRNMWQIGLHLGLPQVAGDVRTDPFSPNHSPAWGAGLNIRKGLGYSTSLRLHGMFGFAYGQDYTYGAKTFNKVVNGAFANSVNPDAYSSGADYSDVTDPLRDSLWVYNYRTKIIDGSLDFIVKINSLNFHNATPKMSVYVFGGAGVLTYNTDYDALDAGGNEYLFDSVFVNDPAVGQDPDEDKIRLDEIRALMDGEYETQAEVANQAKTTGENDATVINPMVSVGGGIGFKLGKRVELGIEHRASYIFDDLIDGERWEYSRSGREFIENGAFSDHNDIVHYTSIVVGVNLGSKSQLPTWEVNPLNFIYNKLAEIDPDELLKDTDDDGVIDRLDREPDTAAGTPVDTHGVSLDSDKDGCKDSEDPEPFSTPNLPIENCQNQWLTENDVNEIIDERLKKFDPGSGTNWYLPMIFFDLDKSKVRPEEVSKLEHVYEIMSQYPKLKVEVVGHADTRASESYNLKLSEDRAKASISYLTAKGIPTGSFVMKYVGETDNMIPNARNEAEHQQNRRVEFHIVK
ncbi:MAG: OmpA family protein [Chitinophagales bacterium]|nr:OmpA family protein [Chitinophagales bacterium]